MKWTIAIALVLSTAVYAQDDSAEARRVAQTYLNALTGQGSDSGKDLLLGGATMTAQMFTLENWKILSEDPVRKEKGELADALAKMKAYDHAGYAALHKMMHEGPEGSTADDDVRAAEIDNATAAKLLGPTHARAAAFKKAHPVLAYVARVDKEVYWHPKNPIRPLLAKTSGRGTYEVVVYRYVVQSLEGAAQTPRRWPLRVLRFRAGDVDTGWKVLPASDWNGE